MFPVPPIVFLVVVPVVVLAVLAVAVWDIRRTWRRIDRETQAARDSGFFDGELERQLAAQGERRANHRLGSSWDWPQR